MARYFQAIGKDPIDPFIHDNFSGARWNKLCGATKDALALQRFYYKITIRTNKKTSDYCNQTIGGFEIDPYSGKAKA